MSRAVSESFLKDLKSGLLSCLTERIQRDDTLMLALRGSYVNVYYRGGSILLLREGEKHRYEASFDKAYLKFEPRLSLPDSRIEHVSDMQRWIDIFPALKENMNEHFAIHRKAEREFQQLAAWENNRSKLAKDTEYFITDIEYADRDLAARFDMLGFRWLSSDRRNETRCRPVLLEMKYGIGAYEGASGIAEHIADLTTFLRDPSKHEALTEVISAQFEQLSQLGLVEFNKHSNYQRAIISGRPEVIFVLANHNPRSSTLHRIVSEIREPDEFDLRFFVSSFAGYGMHKSCMLNLSQFQTLLGQWSKLKPATVP